MAEVSLITNFKEHLRDEIGVATSYIQVALCVHLAWYLQQVFIEQIFLKILESGNSDFLHKSRVGSLSPSHSELWFQPCCSARVMLGAANLLQTLHRCAQVPAHFSRFRFCRADCLLGPRRSNCS